MSKRNRRRSWKARRKQASPQTQAKNAAAYPFTHGHIARQMRAVTIHY